MTPEIVLGPPGTGKTTTLLNIVDDELSRGVDPGRIGYFSFTRKAADVAKNRACDKFGMARNDLPFFRTIHSLCFNRLGFRRSEVLEGRWMREFADYAGIRINGLMSEDGTTTGFEIGDRALFIENLARVRGEDLRSTYNQSDEHDLTWHELDRVSKCLAQFKEEHGLVDYTDMLEQFLSSGVNPVLDVLVVDEGQDLSPVQWRVIRKVAQNCRRVVVAGDDDQAIYPWAGADVEQFVNLSGPCSTLTQSYRVPRSVQDVAHWIVSEIHTRRPKDWRPRDDDGDVVRVNDLFSADVSGDDVLVLARNTYVLHRAEKDLRSLGIVYERHGRSSIPSELLVAISAWENLRNGAEVVREDVALIYKYVSSRNLSVDGRKLVDLPDVVRMSDLVTSGLRTDAIWHEAMDRIPADDRDYIIAARQRGERLRRRPRVKLSTIHASKGDEARHVILLTEVAKRTYREQDLNPDDELRCWYVAVTRAREKLTIVNSSTPLACRWL